MPLDIITLSKTLDVESLFKDVADVIYDGTVPTKNLLYKSQDIKDKYWEDASGMSINPKLVDGNCFVKNSSDSYIRRPLASGIGAGDFYYYVRVKILTIKDGGRIFSDGETNGGGKKIELLMYQNGLTIGLRNGTAYTNYQVLAAGEYSAGDVIEATFTRVGGQITSVVHNITKGITNTKNISDAADFSSTTQSFVLGGSWDNVNNVIFAPSVGVKAIYYEFKCGEDADNLVFNYAFSEGAGSTFYNKVDGDASLKLYNQSVDTYWSLDEYSSHSNLKHGFTDEVTYGKVLTSVYQGAQDSDAFSSMKYLGNGICLAGKRSSTIGNRIFRSTDFGKTWSSVGEISGYTGKHTYFFGHDGNGVVICGTGDEGNACLMRSTDWGVSWSVILSSEQLRTMVGTTSLTLGIKAVFTPIFMGEGRWLCNLRNDETNVYLLESLDNGVTWNALTTTGLSSSGRKMKLMSNGTLVYSGFIQNDGVFISRDGGYTWVKTGIFNAFSGICEVGDGEYLVGTYATGTTPLTIDIYKTIDDGDTWYKVGSTQISSNPSYFREIIKPHDNLIIAYACASETTRTDRNMKMLYSTDNGETWVDKGNPFSNEHGQMNAIYEADEVSKGVWLLGAQPDSNILRSHIPNLKLPTLESNVTDVLGNPISNPSVLDGHNASETKIQFPNTPSLTEADVDNVLWDGINMKKLGYTDLVPTSETSEGIKVVLRTRENVKDRLLIYSEKPSNIINKHAIDSYVSK